MQVCEECHERDRKVIQCDSPIEEHIKWSRGFVGKCDVCGKHAVATYYCAKYHRLMEKVAEEDSYVRM